MRKYIPNPEDVLGEPLPEGALHSYKLVQHINSGANGSMFRAHSEDLNRDLALKLIPRDNLRTSPSNPNLWRLEAQKPNSLGSPSVVRCDGSFEWVVKEKDIDCVVFSYEFIDGPTLADYIKANKGKLSVGFIKQFLQEMLILLNEMKELGITHGDLHHKNILIQKKNDRVIGSDNRFRVTDFGVVGASTLSSKDDFHQTAIMLKELLGGVNYQNLNDSRDRYDYNQLNDYFINHLLEDDPTRYEYSKQPKKLYEKLDGLQSKYIEMAKSLSRAELSTPFDYLSCEQIGESHNILKALYSDLFLGLEKIESKNNLVLTGPRGCGKSTVFKSLSTRHRLLTSEGLNISELGYIGIYYRCDDLYFSFPRYQLPKKSKFYDIPLHFITATLLGEVLDTVMALIEKKADANFFKTEQHIARQLWRLLELKRPVEPGADSFRTISKELEKERGKAVRAHRKKSVHLDYYGPNILAAACKILNDNIDFLAPKPFYFFVDDYSSPKISDDLQENLNRLFMQRIPNCFFKLATESSVSYIGSDIDKKRYIEGREYQLQDLGFVFISEDTKEKNDFIEDVFSRRFKAVKGFPFDTLEQLVGSNKGKSQNQTARDLKEIKGKYEWWGKETIEHMCSGDIHYIIDLVGKMVSEAGGVDALKKNGALTSILPKDQNKAIRQSAGIFLKNLYGAGKHGKELVKIVTAFCKIAQYYLKNKVSKNEEGKPPHLASRVEPLEEFDLPSDAQKIYKELLRYSIFVEDFRGKSIRGKVVQRLHIRRFLIPHFNITFSRRDSVTMDPDEIREWLLNPESFAEHYKKKLQKKDAEKQAKQKKSDKDKAESSRQANLQLHPQKKSKKK